MFLYASIGAPKIKLKKMEEEDGALQAAVRYRDALLRRTRRTLVCSPCQRPFPPSRPCTVFVASF